jgi:hypothetical protein
MQLFSWLSGIKLYFVFPIYLVYTHKHYNKIKQPDTIKL